MRFLVFLFAVVSLFSTAGCSDSARMEQINVFAGAGLKDVLPEIAESYKQGHSGTEVTFNFAGAGTLQKQIEQGAQADLLVVPGEKQLAALERQNLVDKSTKVDLASDILVLVVPKGQEKIKGFSDLPRSDVIRVSIGNPETVPAGEKAKEALTGLGIWDRLEPKLILARDVRQVLTYVETGNVDAGLVYLSSAEASRGVVILAGVPPEVQKPVAFRAVLTTDGKRNKAASDFLRYLSGAEAAEIFKKYSFKPVQQF